MKKDKIHKMGPHGAIGFLTKQGRICAECYKPIKETGTKCNCICHTGKTAANAPSSGYCPWCSCPLGKSPLQKMYEDKEQSMQDKQKPIGPAKMVKTKYTISTLIFDSLDEVQDQLGTWRNKGTLDPDSRIFEVVKEISWDDDIKINDDNINAW